MHQCNVRIGYNPSRNRNCKLITLKIYHKDMHSLMICKAASPPCRNLRRIHWVLLQVPSHAAFVVFHQHAVFQTAGGRRNLQVQLTLRIHRCAVACGREPISRLCQAGTTTPSVQDSSQTQRAPLLPGRQLSCSACTRTLPSHVPRQRLRAQQPPSMHPDIGIFVSCELWEFLNHILPLADPILFQSLQWGRGEAHSRHR